MNLLNFEGPAIIMFAASLWALDALIRTPLTKTLSATSIVFYEHLIGLLVLSPLFIRSIPILKKLDAKTWGVVFLLALVSSVGGTVLFTQALASSFASYDFITPLLLQKLQPLLVIVLSAIFLKERFHKSFFLWAPLALIGSYLMSFGLLLPRLSLSGKELVVLLALGASFCWGSGTIISKTLLKRYTTRDATFLRFLAALPLSLGLSILLHQFNSPAMLTTSNLLRFIAIALSTGAVGLLIYYRGLAKTPAHISTIAELTFPLVSVIIGLTALNPYGAPQTLTLPQIIGIILLLISITAITLSNKKLVVNIVVKGKVIKGAGDGKKLGFPTANIRLTTPLNIEYGVYAAVTRFNDKNYDSVVHYGPRVVFDETKPLFEVYIFDFNKSLYGKTLTVELKQFIRPTMQFSSVQELVSQMEKDCKEAKQYLHV